MLRAGCYGDLAVLSDDYFAVPEAEIAHIESLLTVVGGRIVYAAGEYEGLDEPMPAVTPEWSPVAHFGGYQATPVQAAGARQAELLGEAAAESENCTASGASRRGARRLRTAARWLRSLLLPLSQAYRNHDIRPEDLLPRRGRPSGPSQPIAERHTMVNIAEVTAAPEPRPADPRQRACAVRRPPAADVLRRRQRRPHRRSSTRPSAWRRRPRRSTSPPC